MDCQEFDRQVVGLEQIADVARDFVLVRLLRIENVDLNVFAFDLDLTWAAFFMNAAGKIHGRYGGRDEKGPDTRNSLAGLRFAMQAALAAHRQQPKAAPPEAKQPPLLINRVPAARGARGCIHCHQAKEILRQQALDTKTWDRASVFSYPLPENIGITLDLERGNLVKKVLAGSAADRSGVKVGDELRFLNGVAVHSLADAQFGLHQAPAEGKVPLVWHSGGKERSAALAVAAGWRRTNIAWRPSLLDILPSLTVFGDELTAQEKQALGLSAKRLAFRQDPKVPSAAQAMGVQAHDIILGIDDRQLEMTMEQFLGYVRQNYLSGDAATLNILRNGKRVDLKVTLK